MMLTKLAGPAELGTGYSPSRATWQQLGTPQCDIRVRLRPPSFNQFVIATPFI